MPEVILHHYEASPFGQAMRRCLALKGISWKSVEAPMVSPKPELSALTGGYERIPVLQIGADIYCDTDCITEALESHQTEPSLYPGAMGRAAKFIALWSGNLWFMPAVGTALGNNHEQLPDAFWEDRAKRFGMDRRTFLPAVPHMQGQFYAGANLLKRTLADGRKFIAGESAGHADFAMCMNLEFVGMSGITPADLGPEVAGWYERVSKIGFGQSESWTPQQAIEHAAQHEPAHGDEVDTKSGFELGQTVSVKTDSPDPAAVTGALIGLDDKRISLSRQTPEAGKVHVHFPRMGQILTAV